MPELDERLRRLFDSPPPVSLDEAVGRRARAVPAGGRWRHRLVIAAAVCAILAGVGALVATGRTGSTHVSGSSTTSSPTAQAPVEIGLVLDRTGVNAGTPIDGEALLTNTTGRTMTVNTCARDGWLFVGLTNNQVAYFPNRFYIGCLPTIQLKPGLNRFPISILTDFQGCVESRSEATPQVPACLPANGVPPLPAGSYVVKTVVVGLPAGTRLPPAISVTLLPVGTVTGYIEPCEGRPTAGAPYAAGTVTAYLGHQTYKEIAPGVFQTVLPTTIVTRQHVGQNRPFAIDLPPGRYVLVAP